jgi:hypothetical protein
MRVEYRHHFTDTPAQVNPNMRDAPPLAKVSGVTVCTIISEKGNARFVGRAFCSTTDNYSKKAGTKRAYDRAVEAAFRWIQSLDWEAPKLRSNASVEAQEMHLALQSALCDIFAEDVMRPHLVAAGYTFKHENRPTK